jgi:hypothetical protein
MPRWLRRHSMNGKRAARVLIRKDLPGRQSANLGVSTWQRIRPIMRG